MCVCESCGKIFTKPKWVADSTDRHFCSVECFRNDMWWSKEDEAILKNNYGKKSYEDIAKMLSRDIKSDSIHRKAFDMGITQPVNVWTQDEINILLKNYSIKPMQEILELLPNRTMAGIMGQARKYNLKSYFYLNRIYKDYEIEYIKNNYDKVSYDEMSKHLNRSVGAIKLRMYMLGLHKPTEIANYGNLYNYVRQRIVSWKNKIKEENHYTCEITGKRSNIVVHHIRSFNLLLEECVDALNFPIYDDFSLYTQQQLDTFVETFLNIQEYYGAYVCINEEVHKSFHHIYGYGDNTQDQWDSFVSQYKVA